MVTDPPGEEAGADTLKVALVAAPGTVTLAGTVAIIALLLDRVTTAPPVGARPAKVTVPVDEPPGEMLVGFNETLDKATVTVRAAVLVTPL
jgi:hypothetical protein